MLTVNSVLNTTLSTVYDITCDGIFNGVAKGEKCHQKKVFCTKYDIQRGSSSSITHLPVFLERKTTITQLYIQFFVHVCLVSIQPQKHSLVQLYPKPSGSCEIIYYTKLLPPLIFNFTGLKKQQTNKQKPLHIIAKGLSGSF